MAQLRSSSDWSASAADAGNESRRRLLSNLVQKDGLKGVADGLGWEGERVQELVNDATLDWSSDEVDGLLRYQKGDDGIPIRFREDTMDRATGASSGGFADSASGADSPRLVVESVAKPSNAVVPAAPSLSRQPWEDIYELLRVARMRFLQPELDRRRLDAAQELVYRLELVLIMDYSQVSFAGGSGSHGDRLWEEAQDRGNRLRTLHRKNSRRAWIRWLAGDPDLWREEFHLALRDMSPGAARGSGWEPGVMAQRLGLDEELRRLWK